MTLILEGSISEKVNGDPKITLKQDGLIEVTFDIFGTSADEMMKITKQPLKIRVTE